jgi:hypothetical protein
LEARPSPRTGLRLLLPGAADAHDLNAAESGAAFIAATPYGPRVDGQVAQIGTPLIVPVE